MAKDDIDKKTVKLANEVRDVLGRHLADDSVSYQELITSCLIAIAIEAGRLRWLAISTEKVTEDKFDEIFWTGVMNHYQENKQRYGTIN